MLISYEHASSPICSHDVAPSYYDHHAMWSRAAGSHVRMHKSEPPVELMRVYERPLVGFAPGHRKVCSSAATQASFERLTRSEP